MDVTAELRHPAVYEALGQEFQRFSFDRSRERERERERERDGWAEERFAPIDFHHFS